MNVYSTKATSRYKNLYKINVPACIKLIILQKCKIIVSQINCIKYKNQYNKIKVNREEIKNGKSIRSKKY